MWSGRAFQVAEPACENARSPNFMRSREVEDERSPERDLLALWRRGGRWIERRLLSTGQTDGRTDGHPAVT